MPARKEIDMNLAIRLYRDDKLPTTKVSKVVGCCVQTLITRLREFGVEIRCIGWGREKISLDTIRHEYIDLFMSTASIAKKHSMSQVSIWERLVKGDVQMRDRKEEARKACTRIYPLEHRVICDRYKTNKHESCQDIANDYNVHKTTIANILIKNGIRPEHEGARIKSYKGGITPLHTRIRNCEKSMIWRRSCMIRDDYTCQATGERGGKLEVHHIKSFSKIFEEFVYLNSDLDPEENCDQLFDLSQHYDPFWDTSNGKTLSEESHHLTHTS